MDQPVNPSTWRPLTEQEISEQLIHIGYGFLCVGEILTTYAEFGAVGVVVSAPIIAATEACRDLTEETWKQGLALFACIPRYGPEVCLLPH